jgi:hypothetical protein
MSYGVGSSLANPDIDPIENDFSELSTASVFGEACEEQLKEDIIGQR